MANNQNISNVVRYSSLLAIALALAGGCSSKPKTPITHGEEFHCACEPTSVGLMNQAQAAAGARADAMLYDRHFHGDALNSLGQTKLDLILKGSTAGDAVVVYLNVPHDQVAARQMVVLAYLKNAGLKDSQTQVREGFNPSETTPAAYNLGGIYKGDGTAADAGTGGTAATVAGPTAGH